MDTEDALALLPVLPWTLAALTVVLLVGLAVPPGGPRDGALRAGASPVGGRRSGPVLALLAVAVVLGCRLGPASELDNPLPALVVGLGLPALVLLPGRRRARPDGPGDVRPAAVTALAVVGWLVVPVAPSAPEVLGRAVGAYALLLAVVGVALGRDAAGRTDVLGLLGRWSGPGRRLAHWRAPTGATAVLAVLLGGAWAERYERSDAWAARLAGTGEVAVGLLVALLVAAAGAALLHRAAGSAAAPALLPLAVAALLAGAARRALISAQLLADQLLPGSQAVDPDPLGLVGGQALALAVVALGGALGAGVLARRLGEGAARLPGLGVLLLLTTGSAVVVLQP